MKFVNNDGNYLKFVKRKSHSKGLRIRIPGPHYQRVAQHPNQSMTCGTNELFSIFNPPFVIKIKIGERIERKWVEFGLITLQYKINIMHMHEAGISEQNRRCTRFK